MLLEFFLNLIDSANIWLISHWPNPVMSFDFTLLSDWGTVFGNLLAQWSFMFPVVAFVKFFIIIISLEIALFIFHTVRWLLQFIRGSG